MPTRNHHLALARGRALRAAIAAVFFVFATGCATYSDKMRETQQDVSLGQPARALEQLNEALEVDSAEDLPESLDGENSLLLLERGTVLQSMGKYKLAARDMQLADEKLDLLDLSSDTGDDLAKWLYSDSSTNYRSPAYERLLLNTLNMINFMAVRDFQSAKVEARRFQIMEDYYIEEGKEDLVPRIIALGNYVAGCAFEGARDYSMATRYYSRAWHFGLQQKDFRERLEALYRVSGWAGQELDWRESGIDAIRNVAKSKAPISPADYREQFVANEVVIFVQSGLAPWKRAERIPIGLAVTYASSHRRYFSPAQQRQANELAASGALKWLNFPQLTFEGVPPGRLGSVRVDGGAPDTRFSIDVARAVEAGWNDIAGPLIAASLTRMITRAVAGTATREITRSATKGEGSGTASALGILAQLIVEGTLTAMDKPDTRSWTTLPANIQVMRTTISKKRATIEASVGGITAQQTVETSPTNLTIVNFSKFR